MRKRVEWISIMHKQNLNGRETEDELFEAGILAGIKETEGIMYSEEELHDIIESYQDNMENNPMCPSYEDWFKQFKKK